MKKILHSDLNNFYASVECLLNPQLRDFPVVVCGKVEERHGIILAKNMIAKKMGVKTGMVLYQAQQLCPNLKCVEAHHGLYAKYSKAVKDIYREYTTRVESFGIDEAWLDVSSCKKHGGDAVKIAEEIRERVKQEIGLTVSIGVSFNKVFAKLASDMKKPDATTVISQECYKQKVWPLPVEELLYVGRATKKKLNELTIKTIGDLALFDKKILKTKLGKWGEVLHDYANGKDTDIVHTHEELSDIKSVGNSLTFYRDLKTDTEVEALLILLSESVCSRMLDYGYKMARTVHLTIMDNNLHSTIRMTKISPSNLAQDFADKAFELFKANFKWNNALVRGLGVAVSDFVEEEQLCLDFDPDKKQKQKKLQDTVETLRNRFGRNVINKAVILTDGRMSHLNIKEDNTVKPGKESKAIFNE